MVVNWAMIGVLLTVVGMMSGITLLAMDERNRRKFWSREDEQIVGKLRDEKFTELDRKVERNAGLFIAIDDRVGDLEEKTALLEERQTLQWKHISEQMAATARTVDDATRRMEKIGESQQTLALRLERLSRDREGG